MSRRRHKRLKRRIPCEITVGSQSSQGIVLDVSPGGLFVQTNATLEGAGEVIVCLAPDGYPEMVLRMRLARVKRVPPRLQGVITGGIGLEVLEAPPEFAYLGRGEPLPNPEPPGPLRRFRVRLVDLDGSGYRTLVAEAVDETDLRERVLAEGLDEWKILQIDPLGARG